MFKFLVCPEFGRSVRESGPPAHTPVRRAVYQQRSQSENKDWKDERYVHTYIRTCPMSYMLGVPIRYYLLLASVDAMSAACLLERYLEDGGAGALDATPCPFPPPADVAMFDYNTVKSYVRSLYYTEDSSIANSVSWLKSQSQRKVSNAYIQFLISEHRQL